MAKSQFEKDVIEFGSAVKGVPSEMRQWWKSAHTWDRGKYTDYEIVDLCGDGITPGPYDIMAVELPDYVLWRRLGYVRNALLILIVVLIALMVIL